MTLYLLGGAAVFCAVVTGVAYVKVANAEKATADAKAETAKVKNEKADLLRDLAEQREAAANRLRAEEAKAAAIAAEGERKLAEQARQNALRLAQMKKELSTYVPPSAVAATAVPRGFLCYYNRSLPGYPSLAAPVVPASSCEPPESPSGVPLDTVADRQAENNLSCKAVLDEVIIWRDWYPKAAATFNQGAANVPANP